MIKNMGNADRIIRLIIAATLATLYYNHIISGVLGIVLLVAAVIFIATSVIGFCPIYALFGWKTCSVKDKV